MPQYHGMLRICSLLVLVLAAPLLATPASAQTVTGPARVIDGDTYDVAGQRIRLFGVDAPEAKQTCTSDRGAWPCGRWATTEVTRRIGGKSITCTGVETDRYGRLVARCTVGGQDIGAMLTRAGIVYAFRKYALDYVDAEKEALFAARGLWRGGSTPPWDYRASQQPAAQTVPAADCAIKGNISGSGRIYHRPGDRSYAKTRINTAKGERWFCSEADARKAGWRAARG